MPVEALVGGLVPGHLVADHDDAEWSRERIDPHELGDDLQGCVRSLAERVRHGGRLVRDPACYPGSAASLAPGASLVATLAKSGDSPRSFQGPPWK
jgi:hypothetical protein